MTPQPTGAAPDITIRQGPEWLARLLLTPPPWVNTAITALGGLAAAVVAVRLYQSGWTVDPGTQLQVGKIGGTVVGVLLGVLAMSNLTAQPYAVDVAVGFVAGYLGMLAVTSRRARDWGRQFVDDDSSYRLAAWLGLATLSLFGPAVVNVRGRGMALFNGRVAIAIVAVSMAALILRRKHHTHEDNEKSEPIST